MNGSFKRGSGPISYPSDIEIRREHEKNDRFREQANEWRFLQGICVDGRDLCRPGTGLSSDDVHLEENSQVSAICLQTVGLELAKNAPT